MTKRFPRLTVWSQTDTVADTGRMPYAPQPTYYALHPKDGSHIKTHALHTTSYKLCLKQYILQFIPSKLHSIPGIPYSMTYSLNTMPYTLNNMAYTRGVKLKGLSHRIVIGTSH